MNRIVSYLTPQHRYISSLSTTILQAEAIISTQHFQQMHPSCAVVVLLYNATYREDCQLTRDSESRSQFHKAFPPRSFIIKN